jgi:hypothetical protein
MSKNHSVYDPSVMMMTMMMTTMTTMMIMMRSSALPMSLLLPN